MTDVDVRCRSEVKLGNAFVKESVLRGPIEFAALAECY